MKKGKFVSILLFLGLAVLMAVSPLFAFASQTVYFGAGYSNQTKESVAYERKTEAYYYFNGGMASYTYYYNNNGCGAVAGAEVLGYYDKTYTDLIPDFSPISIGSDGTAFYRGINSQTDAVTADLINRMDGANGTTVNGFKTGLTSYVNSKGLKTSYTSTMSSFLFFDYFSFDKYKSEINAGRPVVLCLKSHHIGSMSTSGKTDSYSYMYSSSSHIMVGFGYREIRYYRTENVSVWSPVWYNLLRFVTEKQEVNFRSEIFLIAVTGTESSTYLNVDRNITIADAFSVNIYK